MPFDLYIPENLEFRDYLAVVQLARTFADGYDKKVRPDSPYSLDLLKENSPEISPKKHNDHDV